MDDSCDDDDYSYTDDDCNYDDDDGCEKVDAIDRVSYTILQEFEIQKRQDEQISKVSATLFVSKPVACKLLHHFKWDPSSLLDKWFVDEEKTRLEVGLSDTNPIFLDTKSDDAETVCGICFDSFPRDDFHFYPSNCGHLYCVTCWTKYITTSIDNDGPGCLSLKCPYPKCGAAICRDMIDKLVGPSEKEKYNRFLLGSFIEENKKANYKWCPAPGCENAIEFELGSDVLDVTCLCKHAFCWNCIEEVHRPVDCETVSNWTLKNSSESENTAWILANSKPCPKCKRAIEKNNGCMHMTCTAPCNFHFCWLCLGDWREHGEKTGGFFACNKYEGNKVKGVYDDEELKRKRAKQHLEKYTHYYERWDSNHKSRQKAVQDLDKANNDILVRLSKRVVKPETYLEFILKAWEQIIECRRVLKWTYAYGYYLPEDQDRKRFYFEYVQGEAEANLERLHQCAEKELLNFFDEEEQQDIMWNNRSSRSKPEELLNEDEKKKREDTFMEFQEKLVRLTKVTGSYFEKLVSILERGLSEFETEEGTVSCSSSRFGGGDNGDLNKSDYWACSECTFANSNELEVCEMCNVGVSP